MPRRFKPGLKNTLKKGGQAGMINDTNSSFDFDNKKDGR